MRRSLNKHIVPTCALCAWFAASMMHAQVGTTGAILGSVKDTSGAVVPNTSITVIDEKTGNTRKTTTNDLGFFQVSALLPSQYRITAGAPGFKNYIRPGIVLRVNENVSLDIALQVGDVSEQVEVTGAAPLLESASSTVGTVVEADKVRELPLNGRNFVQLTLLVAGATAGNNAGGAFVIGGSTPSVSGNRSEMNNFTLDGVGNNEHFFKYEAIQPSVDAIQEFRVQTNVTSAQFGARAGANVNVATKGGTNEFHGVVFEFLRNDNFDGTDFFAARKPEFKQNQFGGNLGGPIRKDRTFFFGAYEGYRFRRAQNLYSVIPTPTQLSGDLSLDHTGAPAPAIFDPLTSRPDPASPGKFIRTAFPNNRIPSDRLSATSQAYAGIVYPTPNLQPTPGSARLGPSRSNNVNTSSSGRDDDQVIVKVDHRFTDNNQFYVRYADSTRELITPSALQTVTTFLTNDFHNVAVSDTHVFSPNSLLDVKFGYIRDNIIRHTPLPDPGIEPIFDAGLKGIPREFGPFIHPVNFGIPGFAAGGLDAFTSGPQSTIEIKPNMSHIRGRHTFNFGYEFRHEEIFHDGPFGNWNFDAIPTANPQSTSNTGQALGSFLLGLPSTASRIVGTSAADLTRNLYHLYVQDDIRITDRLTLNLGLRYEYSQWFRGDYEGGSKLSWFDIEYNAYDPDPLKRGRFVWEGPNPITGEAPNTEKGFLKPDYNNFAPRVGLAYRLGGKATIRSGYGIFYDSNFVWENQSARGNWPFAANQAVSLNRAFGEPLVFVNDVFPELDLTKVPLSVGQTQARSNRVPYVQQWNFNVQYAFTPHTVLDVGYVGNKGTRLNQWVEQNSTVPGAGNPETRRPFPLNRSALRVSHNLGNSSYNALQLKLEKRFSHGLSFLSSYAWAKSIDIGSTRGFHSMNRFDLRADRGLSDFHSSHVYALSWVWEVPFGAGRRFGSAWPGVADGVLGGWQLTGILAARSGRPVNTLLSFDNANVGQTVLQQRPNALRNPNLPADQQTPERFFDVTAFQAPAQYTFGNSGRNVVIGPGLHRWDLGLYKDFRLTPLGEAGRLQFRGEFFNAFNRTTFGQPGGTFGTPGFGRISNSSPARQIQFGLKLYF